jgi:hypothetical protein
MAESRDLEVTMDWHSNRKRKIHPVFWGRRAGNLLTYSETKRWGEKFCVVKWLSMTNNAL